MEKKRIFVSMHYLELGGAEISLIGLLDAIDKEKYDVDLFLYSHQGELMEFIPEGVNLLPENSSYSMYERPLKEVVKNGFFGIAFARLVARYKYKQYCKRTHPNDVQAVFAYMMKEVEPHLPSLAHLGEYDLAISFLTPHNVVLNKVKAKKKICWIHTDYSKIDTDVELELPVWSGYDHIASISEEVTKKILEKFPSLCSKIIEINNILSPDFVKKRASLIPQDEIKREMKMEEGVVSILSVGRYSTPKRFEYVPDIVKSLREDLGMNVRWYIIGYGMMEQDIKESITKSGMEDYVILLGKKSNPYPYMLACDIYAQPSLYEGNSVTVREAQMLCKPVVVTNYPTASSQIQDGVDGVIVPMDNEGCARGIAEFILDVEKQNKIIDYLKTHDYGNVEEVYKIYKLLE